MSYVLKGNILANKSTGKTSSTKKATGTKSSSRSTKSTTRTSASKSSRSTRETAEAEVTRKVGRPRKTQSESYRQTEIEEADPFFSEAQVDIALIAVIAVGVLMMLANFGLGGVIGKGISGFFFGLFGIIQYILPILTVFAVLFSIANKKNKVAIAKEIAAFIFVMFVSVITELIVHGKEPVSAIEAFKYAMENHNGGGLIGGLIGGALAKGFGLVVSYFIAAIIMIICLILITETFIMGGAKEAMQHKADVAEMKRKRRRDEYELAREAYREQENAKRAANRARRKAEYEAAAKRAAEEQNAPRAERTLKGITFDTTLAPQVEVTNNAKPKGNVEEITFNLNDTEGVQVTDSSRTKLVSSVASTSSHSFFDEPVKAEPVREEAKPVAPVIRGVEDSTPAPVVTEPVVKTTQDNPFKPDYSNARVRTEEEIAASVTKSVTSTVASTPSSSTVASSANSVSNTAVKSTSATSAGVSAASQAGSSEKVANKPYKFPPLNLLIQPPASKGDSKEYISEMSERLIRTLKNFGVDAQVTEVTRGPSVTRYEITIAEGTKVSKVVNLSDDIKLNMAVTDLRMEAPIPGKSAIGIEVPNKEKVAVSLAELIKSQAFKTSKSKISFCVGKDITGDIIIGNIEKYPHILIAGQTGSGKSVCINSIIMSILYHATPEEVKLIMVDPKQVELSVYNGIPHLLLPVVTDPRKAASTLAWACVEMDRRYKLLAKYSVRNLDSYNSRIAPDGSITYTDENGEVQEEQAERLPQIVIILDELADLMMVAGKEVETSICRLAQLARAAGIHLVIATQRPTANVLTGLIKGNVPSRIAFSVASGLDSRVILDENGAENLLGHGDMLYHPSGTNSPVRLQGAFVTDEEISNVVEFVKKNNEPVDREKMQAIQAAVESAASNEDGGNNAVTISDAADTGLDPLLADAGRLVIENSKGSIGYLQRNFRIGFNRAARIMDQLCEKGVVGPELGTKPREIKMTMAEFEELLSNL